MSLLLLFSAVERPARKHCTTDNCTAEEAIFSATSREKKAANVAAALGDFDVGGEPMPKAGSALYLTPSR